MKRAISLLMAFMTFLSIGLVAFADGGVETPYNNVATVADNGANSYNAAGSANTDGGVVVIPDTVTKNVTPFNLEWATDTTGTDYLTIGTSDMYLVWSDGDYKGQVVRPDTVLTPGYDYTFNIYYATKDVTLADQVTGENFVTAAGGVLPVTKAQLGANDRLRVRTKGSTGMISAAIDERGSGANTRYNLDVTTREQYGTKVNDVEITLTVTGTSSTLATSTTALQVGWQKMDDDEIDSYADGDIITIYNDAPVITSKQFQRLAKNYDYKAITFENEDGTWNYTARVSGNSDVNLYNTEEIVEEIIMKLPDQDYKFVNFHSGVKFATNGEMRIDVSDINSEFARMYVYLYRNGTVTPITASYDSHSAELVFRTNFLGTFVVTDTEITDTEIIARPESELPEEPEEPPVENDDVNHNNNANTGMDASMNVLVTLGLASVSAGSAIRRRRR